MAEFVREVLVELEILDLSSQLPSWLLDDGQTEQSSGVTLIRGKLELSLGSEILTLESGDAIYFDSAVRHKYRRVGKQPCSGVIVTTEVEQEWAGSE